MNAETLLSGKRVLLIDNNYLTQKAMGMIFKRKKILAFFSPTAKDALEKLETQVIDAVLLDIQLQGVLGIDFCKTIRSLYPNLPIIIITALTSADILVNTFSAGADDFVNKPPNTKILLQRLANSIARREAERHNAHLMRQLESYIPTSAINEIARPSGIQTINAALLFSDMRGFTIATFDHAVEKVFTGINEAMTMQSLIIREFGGYVDGFAGDGMLAVFDTPDGCKQACKAATKIIQMARQTKVDIWSPLPIGIGINYGEVLRGDLGSESRRAHTVIGSTVNVSARLCGVAKAMEAVCSEFVLEQVGSDFSFKQPTSVQLKGLPTPIKAYTLLVE